MPNAAMHDPSEAQRAIDQALSQAVESIARSEPAPSDGVPDKIREEGKLSAQVVRKSAEECAQRIVDAATAVCARAQNDLDKAEAHANEIRSRAESVAMTIESRSETDAKVAEQMAATIAMILPATNAE